ncbi:unnamed protein product [Prunus armeniaca]
MQSILLNRLPELVLLSPPPREIFTGKMIGYGTRRGKLYYLNWAPDSETNVGQTFTTSGASFERQRDKI